MLIVIPMNTVYVSQQISRTMTHVSHENSIDLLSCNSSVYICLLTDKERSCLYYKIDFILFAMSFLVERRSPYGVVLIAVFLFVNVSLATNVTVFINEGLP